MFLVILTMINIIMIMAIIMVKMKMIFFLFPGIEIMDSTAD